MRKLTKVIAPTLLAALALGAAMPAQAAQIHQRGYSIGAEISQLERAVNRSSRLSRHEAASLKRDVYKLKETFRAYSRNGLSRSEYRALDNRIDHIQLRLQRESRDGNRYAGNTKADYRGKDSVKIDHRQDRAQHGGNQYRR